MGQVLREPLSRELLVLVGECGASEKPFDHSIGIQAY
jgi:hypothetical protein